MWSRSSWGAGAPVQRPRPTILAVAASLSHPSSIGRRSFAALKNGNEIDAALLAAPLLQLSIRTR
jgi:hypothetical protein